MVRFCLIFYCNYFLPEDTPGLPLSVLTLFPVLQRYSSMSRQTLRMPWIFSVSTAVIGDISLCFLQLDCEVSWLVRNSVVQWSTLIQSFYGLKRAVGKNSFLVSAFLNCSLHSSTDCCEPWIPRGLLINADLRGAGYEPAANKSGRPTYNSLTRLP